MSDQFVTTRRATHADLDVLVPLFDAYRQFYEQTSDVALARSFLAERLERDESVVFLAEAGGKALGFTQLYPLFSSTLGRRSFLLNDLFVTPESRAHGVGHALLEAAKQFAHAAGAAKLSLSTAHNNVKAQSLYEANGWSRDTHFYAYNFLLKD
jgi:ribosomal protein S18 acetylase RimI-like enzyme